MSMGCVVSCAAQADGATPGFWRPCADADPDNERFFADFCPGHAWFDLEDMNAAALAAAGIGRVEAMGLDTYSAPDRFFSCRRATHRGEADYGRQLSAIALP